MRTQIKKQQSGFTLIELVMVIVILGILAAFALPRFADLSSEARLASLNGALGSVKSASAIAHAQALVSNITTGNIVLEGTTVTLVFSYPDAATIGDASQTADFGPTVAPAGTTTFTSGLCTFTFVEAADAVTPPVISAINVPAGGC